MTKDSRRGESDPVSGPFPEVPELEFDEDVAPRPEEDIADAVRAAPDTADHSAQTGDGAAT